MKKVLLGLVGVLGFVLLAAGGFLTWAHFNVSGRMEKTYSPPVLGISAEVRQADRQLGERIALVRNGCADCHGHDLSGKLAGEDPLLGSIHGANLTPAALEEWTDEEIARAIRFGVGRDGKALVLMPSHEYNNLSRGDLAALVAYIRSVPAVDKPNGPVRLGPLGKVLIATNQAPLLPVEKIDFSRDFTSKPVEAPTSEFGGYLVNSSCIGCHGPALAGGPIPGTPPDWLPAANLTPAGLKGWTEENFINAMRKGVSKDGSEIRFPMPIEMTSKMNDTELRAIWTYLQTVEPVTTK